MRLAALRRRWFMLTLLALPAVADNPLTLDAAIQTAIEHNRNLAYAALGVERQRLGTRAAADDFAPEVSPYGNLSVADGDTDWRYGMRADQKLLWGTEVGLGAEVTRYPPFVDEAWRSAVKIDVRQPLFRRFGRLANEEPLTLANERLLAEQRHWEQQKAALIVDVVRAFETIVRLEKQVACDTAVLARTDALRELTRIRERQGRASRVDTLRGELQWGQAKTRLETHREAIVAARQDLAELLGRITADALPLVEPPLPDLEGTRLDLAVGTALSNRLDYAQAIDDYRSSRRQEQLARRGLLPDLDLVAEHQQYDKAERFGDSLGFDHNLWSIGIAGQTGLLKPREKTALATATLDVQAAREVIRIKALSVAREVQQAVSAYRQARSELAGAGRNHAAAQARAELARRLFEMGRGDNFAATDAENAWIDAETALLSTRAEVCVTGYRLLQTMGTLTQVPDVLLPKPMEPFL